MDVKQMRIKSITGLAAVCVTLGAGVAGCGGTTATPQGSSQAALPKCSEGKGAYIVCVEKICVAAAERLTRLPRAPSATEANFKKEVAPFFRKRAKIESAEFLKIESLPEPYGEENTINRINDLRKNNVLAKVEAIAEAAELGNVQEAGEAATALAQGQADTREAEKSFGMACV